MYENGLNTGCDDCVYEKQIEFNNPLISVVIPVYKVEKYLNRCLNTIVNQVYQNLEIIIVDDGSPDKCPEICDKWAMKDGRIKVIHKENGGLSAARNAGINVANGEYITFVDSDDWVSKEYVSYLYELIKKTGADLAVGNYLKAAVFDKDIFVNENISEQILSGRKFLLKLLKVNTQENMQYAWCKLYRNFKNTNIRYPEGLIDEDVPVTFQYGFTCNKVVLSTKKIYIYFENKDSILRRQFNRNRFDLLEVWKRIVYFADENCDEEIAGYAKTNYYRAHFGILCNICTEECNPNDFMYIKWKEREVLKVVKKHKEELLKFPMPISRKLVVIGFCICYPFSKRILRILRKRL